jgi:hypothetical protein
MKIFINQKIKLVPILNHRVWRAIAQTLVWQQ